MSKNRPGSFNQESIEILIRVSNDFEEFGESLDEEREFIGKLIKETLPKIRKLERIFQSTDEAQLSAKKQEELADRMNEFMKELSDIIQMMLEAKNKGMEAVARMLQQNFAASLKLQAAAASRGG